MSASRNLGVSVARGTYIAFLDGDDWWRPDKIETQLELFDRHPDVGMVFGPIQLMFEAADGSHTPKLIGLEADGLRVEPDRRFAPQEYAALFLRRHDLHPTGAMIRRSLYLGLGGAEDEFRTQYEDTVFMLKITMNAPVYLTSDATYFYRKHAAASTVEDEQTGVTNREHQRFVRWAQSYLDSLPQVERPVWAGLAEMRRVGFRPRRQAGVVFARRVRRKLRRILGRPSEFV